MRSPKFPYPGAKGRAASTLVSMMPQFGRTYVEPCAGRGNVFFAAAAMLKFQHWVLNDTATASFFDALREIGDVVQVPVRNRLTFNRLKRDYETGDHTLFLWKKAVVLEPTVTFSGGGYLKGGFGGLRSASCEGYTQTLRQATKLLRDTEAEIRNEDWLNLKLESLGSDDFVFFDPPYRDADVRAYSNNFNFDAMIRTLHRAKFKWMLTEYRHPSYLKAFGTPCYTKEVQNAVTNLKICRETRLECVWKNY